MESKTVVTFGEIMLRLAATDNQRFSQAHSLDVVYGGGEANVAVSLANFGILARFITRLPENDLAAACIASLRSHNVETQFILRGGDRMGIYFLEPGVSQRPSKVIYDRAFSSFSTLQKGMLDWESIFSDAGWFHWTGITPAVSESVAEVLCEALTVAQRKGLTISADLNYRKNLWKWGKKASEVMPDLIQFCDVIIGNEEDAEKVFGIQGKNVNINTGQVEAGSYQTVCEELARLNPHAKRIAITLRGSYSASHNAWSAVLWDQGRFLTGQKYDISPIVDRVGGGDSFAGGLIYGLLHYPDAENALKFAIAASCLKHSVWGDFNEASVMEVENLLKDNSGRISR